jgi:hypothetical protein
MTSVRLGPPRWLAALATAPPAQHLRHHHLAILCLGDDRYIFE